MNIFESQENVFLLGRIVVMAIVLPMFLYAIRYGLRVAHEQFMKLGRFAKCAVICIVFGSTGYGGYKHWCTTNPPPDQTSQTNQTSQTSSPTNDPPAAAPLVQVQSPSPRMELLPLLSSRRPSAISLRSIAPSHFDSITNWTARGAWCDWKRIEFGDSFSFPSGTNLLTSVTLMSYGELRESLLPNPYSLIPPLSALPQAVSLEPDMSSVAYGLTSSNSFVFVWENACVNREATNRINAAIELFASGAIAITTQFGDQPPTTSYQLPTNPPGFIGVDQGSDWVAAAFPNDFAAITNKGYSTWLDEDYVGYNEQNGHFRADITVSALPDNGVPCYLVCGPYKVVVTQPGTYSFPLEVFETYEVRTYPVALPLSISTDDGYRGETSLLMSPPMMTSAPLILPPVYVIHEEPRFVITPDSIPLSQASHARISIWCNVANVLRTTFSSWSGFTQLRFIAPSEAEIVEARVADLVAIFKDLDNESCTATISIYDDTQHDDHEGPSCCCGTTHCSYCTCYGCLYEGICYCGHVLTDEELDGLWGGSEP